MYDIIRDSPFGQITRFLTKNKWLRYVEEREDFQNPYYIFNSLPEETEINSHAQDASSETKPEETPSFGSVAADSQHETSGFMHSTAQEDVEANGPGENPIERVVTMQTLHEIEKRMSRSIRPTQTTDGTILVDWYTTDDPDNPQNWSGFKKGFVAFQICIYSFAVYFGSSIYVGAVPEVTEKYDISIEVSSLALALYVFGYGIGPLIFSPLSEIAAVGRNPPYIITLFIYTVLWIPASVVNNFAGFVVLRFLTGFFGSPCLATGGASLSDIYPLIQVPYLLIIWGAATVFGPALAPVVSNLSAPVKGWHWVSWEMLWLSAPILLGFFFFLPETSSATILYYRAKRLRNITGNLHYRSQVEIDQAKQHMTVKDIVYNAVIKPGEINILDPAVLFSTVYTSLVYAIFYSFFESFPLVFSDIYGFKFNISGLPFLGVFPGLFVAAILCALVWHFQVVKPFRTKGFDAFGVPENRLVPGLFACIWLPIGLFLFAWTARPSVHWMASIVGLSLSIVGTFTIIVCMLQYLAFTYPKYSASLFAANDFSRSTLAAGAIMFSRPMFLNLGIHWGVSLLAFLDIVCCVLLYALWIFGPKLRSRSRFAQP
ncbi:major facilitator superfamily domain-containing protein [Talaromyces proteolyticus]|uniref:Major facilitator superfamily domain-containing protein n=1 Tax=Talaromyces proteolyticus TaxID=1131652 RepID=A0AAD4KDC8_9EURO|nr:major facilitator superfamily domain-containing protein [Talaromyces proteolyticus]KAH8688835.1 major facilitator superfamily domain-containing protein [Talaromyces proteolyticus]